MHHNEFNEATIKLVSYNVRTNSICENAANSIKENLEDVGFSARVDVLDQDDVRETMHHYKGIKEDELAFRQARQERRSMMNRWRAVIVLLCVVFCSFGSAFAEPYYSGVYTYTENGDGTACITDIDWEYVTGDLIVPDQIDGLVVTGIGDFAFSEDRASSKSVNVILPETLTSIGDCAFYGAGITSVIVPRSVESIGVGAFAGCTNLNAINVDPNNANYAAVDGALYYKPDKTLVAYVKDAIVPNGIVKIGKQACMGLQVEADHVFVNTIRQIDDSAFESASILVSGLKKTGEYHDYNDFDYYYCYECNLLNDEVEEIGSFAFNGAHIYTGMDVRSDVAITLYPDTIQSIGECAFHMCEYTLGGGKESHNQVILGDASIPISNWAFSAMQMRSGAGELCVPNNMDIVGEYAFSDNELTISTRNKELIQAGVLGDSALSGVTIDVPLTIVDSLGQSACYNSRIPMVTLSDGIEDIPAYAFDESNINQINIPETITSIGRWAFGDMTALTRVDLSQTNVSTIPENAFNSSSISKVGLPDALTGIEAGAFMNCANLRAIDIPVHVTFIGESAFEGSGVQFVQLPNGLQTIGTRAFYSCPALQSLSVPATVSEIDEDAFDRNGVELEVEAASYAERWANGNGIPFIYSGGADLSWLGTDEQLAIDQEPVFNSYERPDFWNAPEACISWLRDVPFEELQMYFESCHDEGMNFGDLFDHVFDYYNRDVNRIMQENDLPFFTANEKSYLLIWGDNRSINVLHCSSASIAEDMANDYSYDNDIQYACGETLVTIKDFQE